MEKYQVFTLKQIGERYNQYVLSKKILPVWGEWEFNEDNLTLYCKKHDYEIDLERLTKSSEILDWVFQIHSKSWCTPELMWNFLIAISDLLCPQKNFCSGGSNKSDSPSRCINEFFKGVDGIQESVKNK